MAILEGGSSVNVENLQPLALAAAKEQRARTTELLELQIKDSQGDTILHLRKKSKP